MNDPDRPKRAIVAGFGPVGRLVAERLETAGFAVTVIELNLDTIQRRLDLDRPVIYGCCKDPEVLARAGIGDADALILTVPSEQTVLDACRLVREINPSIFIAARANFLSMGMLYRQAGADEVIIEEVVTAEAMREAVTQALLRNTP